jgi:hypothetical protein
MVTPLPARVRLLGVRPAGSDATSLRRDWLLEATQQLGDEALRIFGYLASIASEPGCALSPSPEGVAAHFHLRLRDVQRGYAELKRRGVLREVADGYELMDQWGYFA